MTSAPSQPFCPVCGGYGERQPEHSQARIYRCATCTHCYSDPASIQSPEAYGPEYFSDTHRNWFDNPNTVLFETVRAQAAAARDQLALLDVGCGKGDLLRYLHRVEPSWRLTGVDLSPNDDTAGIAFVQGDVFDMPRASTFDVVTSLLVIEHIAEAHRFVNAMRVLCRPGGLLIIATNDEQSVLYTTARLLRRLGSRAAYERLYSHHHLNHFSVRTLRNLLERNSLRVVRTVHHNIPMAAVDVPPASALTRAIWGIGIRGAFALGSLTGRTFLQTVVCEVPK